MCIENLLLIFKVTKCTFHKFGRSGEIEKHDALCILPLNVVNEKIYIFLWFWFIILFLLTFLMLVYRVLSIFSPKLRAYAMYIQFRMVKRECINLIIKKTQMGELFPHQSLLKSLGCSTCLASQWMTSTSTPTATT